MGHIAKTKTVSTLGQGNLSQVRAFLPLIFHPTQEEQQAVWGRGCGWLEQQFGAKEMLTAPSRSTTPQQGSHPEVSSKLEKFNLEESSEFWLPLWSEHCN